MTKRDQAELFCKISFVPCEFPCVHSLFAAENFEFLTNISFGREDFTLFLKSVFPDAKQAFDKEFFYLNDSDFYKKLDRSRLKPDEFGSDWFDCLEVFEELCKAQNVFEGEVNKIEIYSGQQESI